MQANQRQLRERARLLPKHRELCSGTPYRARRSAPRPGCEPLVLRDLQGDQGRDGGIPGAYELGNRQWDVPGLSRTAREDRPRQIADGDLRDRARFPRHRPPGDAAGRAKTARDGVQTASVLLAMYDVSDLRAAEREKDELVRRQNLQMREMRHRIANTLQIIASILLMKAHSVQSRETRLHLQDAHSRVLSLATLQNQLEVSSNGEQVEMRRYLVALCGSLETSITRPPMTLQVHADPRLGDVFQSGQSGVDDHRACH